MPTTTTTTNTNDVPVEDIAWPVGDSDDITVTVRIPNAIDPTQLDLVNLDQTVDGLTSGRPVIIRMAVKPADSPNIDNDLATVFKESHYADQIEIFTQSGATLGQARVLIDKPDTEGTDTDESYCYDIEVTQQDALRSGAQAGTIDTTGGTAIVGSGTDFTKAKVGDVLTVTDGSNEGTPALIESITDATNMVVSFGDWVSPSAGLTYEIRRGKSRTIVKGAFTLEQGQVKG